MLPYKDENDLQQMIFDGYNVDNAKYLDMRENLSMLAGYHYFNSVYTNNPLQEVHQELGRRTHSIQNVRQVQNHLRYICDYKINNLVKHVPNVQVLPRTEGDVSLQKSAELYNSVWQYIYQTHHLKNSIVQWAKDLIELGEAICFVYWDIEKGQKVTMTQNEEGMNERILEQMLESDKVPDNIKKDIQDMQRKLQITKQQDNAKVEFTGGFNFRRVYPLHFIRPAGEISIDECNWLAIQTLMDKEFLKKHYKIENLDEEMSRLPQEFLVFEENAQNPYNLKKDKVVVTQMFWRPKPWMPYGWHVLYGANRILHESQLPYGIFPLIHTTYKSIGTSSRGYSLLQDLKPIQKRINLCISEMVKHQVTVGDDKILAPKNSQIEKGSRFHGVRLIEYNGVVPPQVLPGRSGDHFLAPLMSDLQMMYHIAGVPFSPQQNSEKQNLSPQQQQRGTRDPFAGIIESARQREKELLALDNFEHFITQVASKTLALSKFYLSNNALIPMIGKDERVNIRQFKIESPIKHVIKILPRTDDVNTFAGKQMVLNQALQYVGQNLPPEMMGVVLTNMPFLNDKEIFKDLTMDIKSANNMILAMDAGEGYIPQQFDNAPFMMQKLTTRMREADFKQLDERIQTHYYQVLNAYQNMIEEKQKAIQAQNQDQIPVGGYPINLPLKQNYQKQDGSAGTKPIQLMTDTISWLMQRLQQQSHNQEYMGKAQDIIASQIAGTPQNNTPQK